ncbi:hypothetical protein OPT61_g6463 [Boeremia exigua]|uniref:Uncharacterized protein n=1 Tax=Boeremia exigua TaxID=749465 RepID=A0ACC2I6I5_9PLEO|nr:hypothetical protein OPT61_g6463 [Boeremia exigua]
MPDSLDELIFHLACKTPLPCSRTTGPSETRAFTAEPYTCAQASIEERTGTSSFPPLYTSTISKKRTRKPEFGIFIDSAVANTVPSPSPKKLKPNERLALAVKITSVNATPTPSPCEPDTPFPFSPADPLWENTENYDTRPCLLTPPPTPGRSPPAPSRSPPNTPQHPTTPSRRSSRKNQLRRDFQTKPLPPPLDMILYNTLELDDWRVTEEEIKAAYKKVARDNHPDKVAKEQRDDATQLMQTMNAAKEVLLDSKRRRAYHKTGKLPWRALVGRKSFDSFDTCHPNEEDNERDA